MIAVHAFPLHISPSCITLIHHLNMRPQNSLQSVIIKTFKISSSTTRCHSE
uniref:Uncharacterized protein n=1 Tax=Arundo donax TaxID=35708 RepID=A0A0A9H8C5_ARUDO